MTKDVQDYEKLTYPEILETCTEHEKAAILRCQAIAGDADMSEIGFNYRLGEEFSHIRDLAREDENTTTAASLGRVGAALERERDFIYNAARAAETWKIADLQRLSKVRGPDNFHLSWSHFTFLCRVKDEKTRKVAAKEACKACIKARDMPAWLSEHYKTANDDDENGGKTTLRGGTRLIPDSIGTFFSHNTSQVQSLLGFYEESWQCDKFDAPQALRDLPLAKLNTEVLTQAENTVQLNQQLAGAITKLCQGMVIAVDDARSRLQKQDEAVAAGLVPTEEDADPTPAKGNLTYKNQKKSAAAARRRAERVGVGK